MKSDAIFEGGGIKGIAFLGAVEVMEKAGYRWERLAGTSAGSIIASLLAAGMTAKEIASEFLTFPFHLLEKDLGLNRIPYLGPFLSVQFYNGIYPLDPLQSWLEKLLANRGVVTFGDLPDDKLKIIVTDISRNQMAILPDDLPSYGVTPSEFPLALAIRMSCSIPFVFRPSLLGDSIMVDGGVLSNYPIWIFDSTKKPQWPTLGFRLSGTPLFAQPTKINGPIRLVLAIVRTMLENQNHDLLDHHSAARTIMVKGIPYNATQFNLTPKQKRELVQLGKDAAIDFLIHWNFEQYITSHRSEKRPIS